jgi:hypothetical protein
MLIPLMEMVKSNPVTQGEENINTNQPEGDPTDHEQRDSIPIQQNIHPEVPLLLDSTHEHMTLENISTTMAPTNPTTTDESSHDTNNKGTKF